MQGTWSSNLDHQVEGVIFQNSLLSYWGLLFVAPQLIPAKPPDLCRWNLSFLRWLMTSTQPNPSKDSGV